MPLLFELLIPLGVAFTGWTQSVLLSLQTWESVRFARRRLADADADDDQGDEGELQDHEQVAVLVPCKGADDDLRTNLQPLFEQTHRNYEIIFLVESPQDAASHVLGELTAANQGNVAARIVYTGRAIESGQKVHNLLTAIETLSDDITTLAFVDSDASPRREWLARLLAELNRPVTGAVTGYRWMIPLTNHPANLFVYSLNSALAGLMGPGGHYHVWGGSWAIKKDTFESIGLREAWYGTLSDDLVASRALHAAGLKVRFSPHSVSCSEINVNWSSAFEFIRRQYLIVRNYAPRLWRLGMANAVSAQLGIWGSLACAVFLDRPLARAVAATTFVLLYALGVIRGYWRQQLAECYANEYASRLRTAVRVDVWLAPVLGLVNMFLLLHSAFGNQIQWRGIRYWISPGGRILTLGRQPADASDAEPVILKFPTYRDCPTETIQGGLRACCKITATAAITKHGNETCT